jgi:hypothetical protein
MISPAVFAMRGTPPFSPQLALCCTSHKFVAFSAHSVHFGTQDVFGTLGTRDRSLTVPIPTYSAGPCQNQYRNIYLLKNSCPAEGTLSGYINSSKCQGQNRIIEETHITKNAETAGSLALE